MSAYKNLKKNTRKNSNTHTHTHTHIYIYIYIYNSLEKVMLDSHAYICQPLKIVALSHLHEL
jgi:hypothetical protein